MYKQVLLKGTILILKNFNPNIPTKIYNDLVKTYCYYHALTQSKACGNLHDILK